MDQVARGIAREDWQELSAGAGSKGPRLFAWARIDTAGTRDKRMATVVAGAPKFRRGSQTCGDGLCARFCSHWHIIGGDGGGGLRARGTVEQCFEEGKGEVGLDEYGVRSWHGWYRHITLSMLAMAFLAALRVSKELQANDRASGTIRRYKSAVEGFLAWYSREEQRPLTFFNADCYRPARLPQLCATHTTSGYSTVNGQIGALRAFCAWLTEEHYLEVNPAKRLKLVGRQDASSREGLDGAQANALLRQARTSRDSLRNYAIIQVLLQTGMWLDECSQLLLDDIELGERSGWVTIRQGKGNKARVIPLNASLRLAIRTRAQIRRPSREDS